MTPLVSIIINNYNYGRFLKEAIESALQQTYDNIEIIIVDDGSVDNSRDIINKYSDQCIAIFKENGGQASAFNIGITASTGEYILLLDSDDYLFERAIEVCLATIRPGLSRVYFKPDVVDTDGNQVDVANDRMYFDEFEGDVFDRIKLGGSFPFSPTSMNFFNAEYLKATLPIPVQEFRICADTYILVRSALAGPVCSVNQVLGAYRIHSNNNFARRDLKLADRAGLKAYIDNYYRIRQLISQACRERNFDYSYGPDYADYIILQGLIIGYRLGIESQHFKAHSRKSLLEFSVNYLRHGTPRKSRRIMHFSYALLLIYLPSSISEKLAERVDQWRSRRDR